MFQTRWIALALAAFVLAGCETAAFDFPWQRERVERAPAPGLAAPPAPEAWAADNDVDAEERERAVAECHAMARAQVERDMRVDESIRGGLAREDATDYQQWRERVDSYGYRERQRELFERCMRERGFER